MEQRTPRIHNTQGTLGHTLRDFYPLIAMGALVMSATALGTLYLDQDPMLAFMGYFFLVFGTLKVLRIHNFVRAYQMYDVLAKRSNVYAYSYPFLELGFAFAYLFAWHIEIVSALVTVVMIIGAYGVYRKLRTHEVIPCACLGTVFTVPMTWVTLGEDVLMASMALLILI